MGARVFIRGGGGYVVTGVHYAVKERANLMELVKKGSDSIFAGWNVWSSGDLTPLNILGTHNEISKS